MEVKIKDWVIKKYVSEGFYLVDAPSTNPDDNGKLSEIVANKATIQAELGIDEKELDEILAQVK